MRQKIVAGNWKMNKTLQETEELIKALQSSYTTSNTEVIIAPTYVNLYRSQELLNSSKIKVAAQNMHFESTGAFTGEISAEMLQSIGVETVILGHSERRDVFFETDEIIAKKVRKALDQNLRVIFCFGEQLEERKSNAHFEVVSSQLNSVLSALSETDWNNVVLAYEPVWAIGTGETASPEQAQEMHKHIRNEISAMSSEAVASQISILYGGSVKPANAAGLFSKEDIDGGLIGGASLKADDFLAIVDAAE